MASRSGLSGKGGSAGWRSVVEGWQEAPVFLFLGEEEYAVSEALDYLAAKVLNERDEIDRVDAEEAGVEGIRVQMTTPPFLSTHRLVVARGIDSLSAAELSQLEPYLSDPTPGVVVAFVARSLDKRTKFYRALSRHGQVVEFTRLRGQQLERWLASEARRQGLQLTAEQISLICQWVGDDMRALKGEVEKLATYVGPSGEITDEELMLCVGKHRDTGDQYLVFRFADAVGLGRPDEALELLHKLLYLGRPPLVILAMIARQLRLILRVHDLRQKGLSAAQAAGKLGLPVFVVRKLFQQAAGFRIEEAVRGLELVMQVDRALKTGGDRNASLLLERLVFELAG